MDESTRITDQRSRFWSKVAMNGDCWIWTGNTSTGGYGTTRFNGRTEPDHHRTLLALLDRMARDSRELTDLINRTNPALTIRPVHTIDESVGDDGWCVSCHRDDRFCTPIVPHYAAKALCRWCGDFVGAHQDDAPHRHPARPSPEQADHRATHRGSRAVRAGQTEEAQEGPRGIMADVDAWVVTRGEYEDSYIAGLFATKELAEQFAAYFGDAYVDHEPTPVVTHLDDGIEWVKLTLWISGAHLNEQTGIWFPWHPDEFGAKPPPPVEVVSNEQKVMARGSDRAAVERAFAEAVQQLGRERSDNPLRLKVDDEWRRIVTLGT